MPVPAVHASRSCAHSIKAGQDVSCKNTLSSFGAVVSFLANTSVVGIVKGQRVLCLRWDAVAYILISVFLSWEFLYVHIKMNNCSWDVACLVWCPAPHKSGMLVQPVISPGSEGLWVRMGWQGLGGSPCLDIVVGKRQMQQHLGNQCHSRAVVLQVPAGRWDSWRWGVGS